VGCNCKRLEYCAYVLVRACQIWKFSYLHATKQSECDLVVTAVTRIADDACSAQVFERDVLLTHGTRTRVTRSRATSQHVPCDTAPAEHVTASRNLSVNENDRCQTVLSTEVSTVLTEQWAVRDKWCTRNQSAQGTAPTLLPLVASPRPHRGQLNSSRNLPRVSATRRIGSCE
jgi:hypothetical protein